jgi:uncharacterized protein
MKLDVFNHILPGNIYQRLKDIAPNNMALEAFRGRPELWDLDRHLALLDEFGDYQQILSLSNPPIEMMGAADATPAIARLCNDALAAETRAHRDRFPSFIASMPMNNPKAAVAEAHRAVKELGACGIQMFSNVLGAPLSNPEYYELFETMTQLDRPVWIHPMRGPNHPDYPTEKKSEHEIWFTFGWPYETTAAVTRLIFAGIFDKLPTLKIITHHGGGMIPFFAEKIGLGFSQIFDGEPNRNPAAEKAGLKKQPIEYYRMLYADTALNGSVAAARCTHAFFGSDHMVFATDAPFDSVGGRQLVSRCIAAVEQIGSPAADQQKIFSGNARRLLKLP